jgi:hypothetical protein
VNLALAALTELKAEIAGRLGEPAVSQLRSTLLQLLDLPLTPAEGIQRTAGMTTVRIPKRSLALPHVRLTGSHQSEPVSVLREKCRFAKLAEITAVPSVTVWA